MASLELTINDAREILNKKILINRLSIQNLDLQAKYFDEVIILQSLSRTISNKKRDLISKLNDVFEKQLAEFTEERQNESTEIYQQINALDSPSGEYMRCVKQMKEYEEEMLNLVPKIDYLEKTIPDSKQITNFKIKTKEELRASSCGAEITELD